MKERVKELAEFHSLNINLMQAIYEDIRFSKKEWVALTDDEVDDIGCDFATLGGDIEGKNWFAFYLAIEAKLKEKNDND